MKRKKLLKEMLRKAFGPVKAAIAADLGDLYDDPGFLETILWELDDIISKNSSTYELEVIRLKGMRPKPPAAADRSSYREFAFDQRIITEKLLGKPALGPSPPTLFCISIKN